MTKSERRDDKETMSPYHSTTRPGDLIMPDPFGGFLFVKFLTILDHTRTRLNLFFKAIQLNFLDHLGPFGSIEDHLRPY